MAAPDTREHRALPEARGERLDAYLARAFPDLTRSRLQGLIADGHVLSDGKPAKAAQRLRGGELLSLHIPAPVAAIPQAEALPVSVLHEDRDLVVVDKAAGMVVHPGAGHASGTLVNALLHRVKDLAGVGGELRPGIVHRLDKDTTGCLVVAKHEQALVALQKAFKTREVQKTYLALVHGVPPAEGRIETLYGRHPIHRQKFTGKVKEGKTAITLFRVREAFDGAALVEVDLLTGRTHQIRVHLAEAGHPLLCDALYGAGRKAKGAVADAQEAVGRQALHAWRLAFEHPRTHKALDLEAPLPEDFQKALTRLREASVPAGPPTKAKPAAKKPAAKKATGRKR
ncbi:RluA family pseudouridine synthase [Corallococcus exiguus]|uniref:RluA family pseudouridine synthase n=1 Tax=Corallococcus TaxID=83461 RepID=UPI000F89CDBD|nr:RluA family pseudouridine synthase [Corallococcus sp. AB018]NRD58052.1 RluA family pseudouridine synthase [Corallococcus exiguus]NRD65057.1 RluA family pseudouridine synthase [Corallococcus exiguus]RUO90466.1 RluA family pseudouridine synthase [Corallococcus sp. AB018]